MCVACCARLCCACCMPCLQGVMHATCFLGVMRVACFWVSCVLPCLLGVKGVAWHVFLVSCMLHAMFSDAKSMNTLCARWAGAHQAWHTAHLWYMGCINIADTVRTHCILLPCIMRQSYCRQIKRDIHYGNEQSLFNCIHAMQAHFCSMHAQLGSVQVQLRSM
jgi:hypothetical protein